MNQTTEIFERLRSARPASQPVTNRPDLWTQIVGTAVDRRLNTPPQLRSAGKWRRLSRRPSALLAFAVVLAGCGTGVTVLTGSLLNEPAAKLFTPAPKHGNPLWGPHRHLHIIRSSIRMVERIKIPTVGAIEYWIARTRLGGDCEAFRLPDGGWAGTGLSPTVNFGGITPTCSGFLYSQMGRHFAYDNVTFGQMPRHPSSPLPGPRQWTVVFGRLTNLPQATRLRDIGTDARTRILQHGYFALVIPEHLVSARTTPGGCKCGRHTVVWFSGPIRLVALTANGTTVATSTPGQSG